VAGQWKAGGSTRSYIPLEKVKEQAVLALLMGDDDDDDDDDVDETFTDLVDVTPLPTDDPPPPPSGKGSPPSGEIPPRTTNSVLSRRTFPSTFGKYMPPTDNCVEVPFHAETPKVPIARSHFAPRDGPLSASGASLMKLLKDGAVQALSLAQMEAASAQAKESLGPKPRFAVPVPQVPRACDDVRVTRANERYAQAAGGLHPQNREEPPTEHATPLPAEEPRPSPANEIQQGLPALNPGGGPKAAPKKRPRQLEEKDTILRFMPKQRRE
jgi:hypothetical protein